MFLTGREPRAFELESKKGRLTIRLIRCPFRSRSQYHPAVYTNGQPFRKFKLKLKVYIPRADVKNDASDHIIDESIGCEGLVTVHSVRA